MKKLVKETNRSSVAGVLLAREYAYIINLLASLLLAITSLIVSGNLLKYPGELMAALSGVVCVGSSVFCFFAKSKVCTISTLFCITYTGMYVVAAFLDGHMIPQMIFGALGMFFSLVTVMYSYAGMLVNQPFSRG